MLLTADAVASPSDWQTAAPFWLTALIVLVGSVLSLWVTSRAREEYEAILKEAGITEDQRTLGLRSENLADMGNWLIDGGGLFAALAGPAIGLLLLSDQLSLLVFIVYTVVIMLVVCGSCLFAFKVPPRGYPNRPLLGIPPISVFSPVTIGVVGLNVVAGVLVFVAG